MSLIDAIRWEAERQGVPADLAVAVAQRESSLNPAARGAAGEVGLFQLMPATAAGLGVDPYSLSGNIQGGVSYLRQLYAQFGDWSQALAAYNAGPGSVARGTVPASTWEYVRSVLTAWGAGGTPASAPTSAPGSTPAYVWVGEPGSPVPPAPSGGLTGALVIAALAGAWLLLD